MLPCDFVDVALWFAFNSPVAKIQHTVSITHLNKVQSINNSPHCVRRLTIFFMSLCVMWMFYHASCVSVWMYQASARRTFDLESTHQHYCQRLLSCGRSTWIQCDYVEYDQLKLNLPFRPSADIRSWIDISNPMSDTLTPILNLKHWLRY